MKKEITAIEAIYGFMAWLTTRKQELAVGSQHECTQVCDLIEEYRVANGLPEPTPNYPENLTMPEKGKYL